METSIGLDPDFSRQHYCLSVSNYIMELAFNSMDGAERWVQLERNLRQPMDASCRLLGNSIHTRRLKYDELLANSGHWHVTSCFFQFTHAPFRFQDVQIALCSAMHNPSEVLNRSLTLQIVHPQVLDALAANWIWILVFADNTAYLSKLMEEGLQFDE